MDEKEITLSITPLDLFLIRKALEEYTPSDKERQRRVDLLTWMHTDWDEQVEEKEIEVTLDTLLEIADLPLRKWLKDWQSDTGNPLEFKGNIAICSIEAVGCINLSIRLKER